MIVFRDVVGVRSVVEYGRYVHRIPVAVPESPGTSFTRHSVSRVTWVAVREMYDNGPRRHRLALSSYILPYPSLFTIDVLDLPFF